MGIQKGGDITVATSVAITGADTSNKNSISALTSNQELFAIRSQRVDILMRNGTLSIAYVRRGSAAAVSGSEAFEIPAGESVVITEWEGAVQVIFDGTGAGTFIAEETYIA